MEFVILWSWQRHCIYAVSINPLLKQEIAEQKNVKVFIENNYIDYQNYKLMSYTCSASVNWNLINTYITTASNQFRRHFWFSFSSYVVTSTTAQIIAHFFIKILIDTFTQQNEINEMTEIDPFPDRNEVPLNQAL